MTVLYVITKSDVAVPLRQIPHICSNGAIIFVCTNSAAICVLYVITKSNLAVVDPLCQFPAICSNGAIIFVCTNSAGICVLYVNTKSDVAVVDPLRQIPRYVQTMQSSLFAQTALRFVYCM